MQCKDKWKAWSTLFLKSEFIAHVSILSRKVYKQFFRVFFLLVSLSWTSTSEQVQFQLSCYLDSYFLFHPLLPLQRTSKWNGWSVCVRSVTFFNKIPLKNSLCCTVGEWRKLYKFQVLKHILNHLQMGSKCKRSIFALKTLCLSLEIF